MRLIVTVAEPSGQRIRFMDTLYRQVNGRGLGRMQLLSVTS